MGKLEERLKATNAKLKHAKTMLKENVQDELYGFAKIDIERIIKFEEDIDDLTIEIYQLQKKN